MARLVALFVRHGSTTLNGEDRFRGPMDVDLDDKGRKQAEEVREFLRLRPVSAAFTSSKVRTKQTADIVLQGRHIVPIEVKNLDALNVGSYSGQLKSVSNVDSIGYYQRNIESKIPGGERIGDFRKRANPEIKAIVRRGEESGTPTIAFVHSSIIHQIGDLYHEDHQFLKVRPGGIVGIYKTDSGYEARALFKESKPDQDTDLTS